MILESIKKSIQDPTFLIQTAGYIGLFLIIFAETGLFFGFFLPGDSILVAAGVFAAGGHMDPWILVLLLSVAAIFGDMVGFFIGKNLSRYLYQKQDSIFFKRKHLLAAQAFYEKHGGKAIVLARFIPVARTFVPTVAGAASMNYGRFAIFNIMGGIIWVFSLVLSGYYLGIFFGQNLTAYLHVIIFSIIALSLVPVAIKWWQMKKSGA